MKSRSSLFGLLRVSAKRCCSEPAASIIRAKAEKVAQVGVSPHHVPTRKIAELLAALLWTICRPLQSLIAIEFASWDPKERRMSHAYGLNEEVLHRGQGPQGRLEVEEPKFTRSFDVCPLRQTDVFDIASSQRKMSE